MNQARAVALIHYRFPGAEVVPFDTSSAGAGITVDPNGRLWADRCGCPRHLGPTASTRGHEARPIQRPRRSA